MTAMATTSPRGNGAFLHAALLYRHPQQLRAAVAEFIAEAEEGAEAVLAVLPAGTLELLADVFAGRADVECHDVGEVGANPARLLPWLQEWRAQRPGRVRVLNELVWPGRSYPETTECLRHEALLNYVLAAEPISMLCPYDAEHLDADVIAGAELTHPELLDDLGRRPSVVYGDPLELAAGGPWPQAEPVPPVSELGFDGDLRALRHAVADDEVVAELDEDRRQALVFAVNEAASNAVRHGDGVCDTRLWRDGDRVVSEVTTASPVADPLAGRRRPGLDALSGRGLWLINQVCDLVELRTGTGGASLRMHVRVA